MTVLIAGGGIGGLGTAIALAARGMNSHILEQAETFSEVGAGIQIGPNGMRILAQWGVADLLEDRGATPSGISIRDGLTGSQLNTVPLGAHARQRYGAPYKVFHRSELHAALLEKARSIGKIKITNGFKVRHFNERETEITVHSASGDQHAGQLLVGADGLWSSVRRQINSQLTPTLYGKSAWRSIIDINNVPEPFNRPQTGLWMAPDAHLVHYPVLGGTAINVVAVIPDQFDRESWNSPGDSEDLLVHFDNWNAGPKEFINSIKDWQKWSLFSLQQLPSWSEGRAVLLGDAAHPPIPFLAQGGVMALEDACALANSLEEYGSDHDMAFVAYEHLRRRRTYKVMKTAHKLGKIYHMRGLMRQARNMVLRAKQPDKLLAEYDWLYGFEFDTTA